MSFMCFAQAASSRVRRIESPALTARLIFPRCILLSPLKKLSRATWSTYSQQFFRVNSPGNYGMSPDRKPKVSISGRHTFKARQSCRRPGQKTSAVGRGGKERIEKIRRRNDPDRTPMQPEIPASPVRILELGIISRNREAALYSATRFLRPIKPHGGPYIPVGSHGCIAESTRLGIWDKHSHAQSP